MGDLPPNPRRSAGQSPASLPSESDGVTFLYTFLEINERIGIIV